MASRRSLLPLKISMAIVGAVLGLVILVLAALPFVLNSRIPARLAMRIAPHYLDADFLVEDLRLNLFSYPELTLELKKLSLTYPHDRFDGLAGDDDEGRGEICDTLLAMNSLRIRTSAREFMRNREISVPELVLDGVRAFLHQYDSLSANWNIVRPLKPDSDSTGSFSIAGVALDTAVCTSARVFFASVPDTLEAAVDFPRLALSGRYRPAGDSAFVRACLDLSGLDANDLVRTLGRSLFPLAGNVSTDARISMSAFAEGAVSPDSLSLIPGMTVSLSVPESHISYSGLLDSALIHIDARAVCPEAEMIDLVLDGAGLHFPGLDLDAVAAVRDITGKDPLYDLDVDAAAVLQKLIHLLPESLSGLKAHGRLDACIKGRARQSQFSTQNIAKSDLSGHITGDCIRVSYPGSEIDAYLLRPEFRLSTFKSLVDDSGKVATVTARIDSVDFDMGEALCAQGRNLTLFGQSSSRSIADEFKYKPFSGKVKADHFFLRGADSLGLFIADTDNLFTLSKRESDSQSVPYLKLVSRFGRVFLKSKSGRVALRDASFVADAQTRAHRRNIDTSQFRQHWRMMTGGKIPEYLSEKEFRTADFNFRLDKSLSDLIIKWNPSMTFNVDKGIVFLPSFPLRNRFSHLKGEFKRDVLTVDSLTLVSGNSDMTAGFRVEGLKRMATRGGFVTMEADLKSKYLNLNELFSAIQLQEETDSTSSEISASDVALVDDAVYDEVFNSGKDTVALTDSVPQLAYSLLIVPANLQMKVTATADSISYSNLLLRNVQTRAEMKERCLQLQETRIDTGMGEIDLDAFYSTKTKKDIKAGFDLSLTNVTAEKVLKVVPAMDEMLPMLKSFKGNLNCTLAATSQLDTNMNLLIPTLNGMFRISGKNLLLEDMEGLRKLAKVLMFKDKNVGRIDDMSVYGLVADNELDVFPFVMSVDRYTMALSGIQNFDTGFDYHVSVLKSPLPFRLGVNFYGSDFGNWKYRLTKPMYKSVKVPLYDDQVDELRSKLSMSIRDVFTRGVEHAVQEAKNAQAVVAAAKKSDGLSGGGELLSVAEMNRIEEMMISQDIEDETEEINHEIEELLKKL